MTGFKRLIQMENHFVEENKKPKHCRAAIASGLSPVAYGNHLLKMAASILGALKGSWAQLRNGSQFVSGTAHGALVLITRDAAGLENEVCYPNATAVMDI